MIRGPVVTSGPYRAKHTIQYKEKIEYPLCQLSLSDFIDKLNEEKLLRSSQ